MSKERNKPELQADGDNGSKPKTIRKSVNRSKEMVLTVTRQIKQKEKFTVDLSFSELNKLVEKESKSIVAIERQIKELKGNAESKAIEACKDLSDLDFDTCVKNKTSIHEKHMGLDAFTEHLEQEIKELNDKISHKLREIRKCQQQT